MISDAINRTYLTLDHLKAQPLKVLTDALGFGLNVQYVAHSSSKDGKPELSNVNMYAHHRKYALCSSTQHIHFMEHVNAS